jgi:hypothetical protein
VLIDGETLVRFMFEHGVGVATTSIYEVKRSTPISSRRSNATQFLAVSGPWEFAARPSLWLSDWRSKRAWIYG